MNNNLRITNATNSLAKEMMNNLGRWCEITMKKTGEKFKVVRTGYGPMEYPERDSAKLVNENGEVVYEGETLTDVAKWICENY